MDFRIVLFGMSLSSNIKERRILKQISRPKLAEMAEVSKGYIYMLESGEMENPSLEILQKVSKALGCTIADLVGAPKAMPRDSGELVIPETLQQFAKTRKKAGDQLPEEDLVSLARIQFRGKRPQTVKDWEYLYEFFQRNFGE